MRKRPPRPHHRCIVPDCGAMAAVLFVGLNDAGTMGWRLVDEASNRRIAACGPHIDHVIRKIATLDGAPARIRAVPLQAVIPVNE